jgi:hypothetical protein
MLSKTLKFDDDVLGVVRAMDWQESGTLGILENQLERKLYERVNKALALMGGKWNRTKGGHVFPADPRPQVEGLLERGTLTVERDGFFQTPPTVVHRMGQLGKPRGKILEPEAGLAAIASYLRAPKENIFCIEKNLARADAIRKQGFTTLCCDFLEYQPGVLFDTIFMNPPFEQGQDIDHVRHAYDCLASSGDMVAVMSEGVFFRSERKSTSFREWLEQVGGVSEQLPDHSFRESGTDVSTRLVVISK